MKKIITAYFLTLTTILSAHASNNQEIEIQNNIKISNEDFTNIKEDLLKKSLEIVYTRVPDMNPRQINSKCDDFKELCYMFQDLCKNDESTVKHFIRTLPNDVSFQEGLDKYEFNNALRALETKRKSEFYGPIMSYDETYTTIKVDIPQKNSFDTIIKTENKKITVTMKGLFARIYSIIEIYSGEGNSIVKGYDENKMNREKMKELLIINVGKIVGNDGHLSLPVFMTARMLIPLIGFVEGIAVNTKKDTVLEEIVIQNDDIIENTKIEEIVIQDDNIIENTNIEEIVIQDDDIIENTNVEKTVIQDDNIIEDPKIEEIVIQNDDIIENTNIEEIVIQDDDIIENTNVEKTVIQDDDTSGNTKVTDKVEEIVIQNDNNIELVDINVKIKLEFDPVIYSELYPGIKNEVQNHKGMTLIEYATWHYNTYKYPCNFSPSAYIKTYPGLLEEVKNHKGMTIIDYATWHFKTFKYPHNSK